MHIVHVKTNAKVGADTEIGPKTLIVGRNGSGKSTIINAVELALTSRVSDIAGRTDVAREADVMQLAPLGDHLFAEVSFDNGTHASYIVEGSTAKAKKAVVARDAGIDPEEAHPIRMLKDAVLGSATTARKFLLSKVAGEVTRANIAELMPTEDMKALWSKMSGIVPKSVSAPDALVTVLEKAGEQQRKASSDAKSAREAAKLVGGGRSAPPSPQEIAAATKARDAARSVWQKVTSAQSAHDRFVRVQQDLAAVTAQAEAAVTEAALLAAKLANTVAPEAPHPVFPHVCATLKASMEAGECLACGNKISQETAKSDLAFLEQSLSTYTKALKEYSALQAEVSRKQAFADASVDRVERLEQELAELAGDDKTAEGNADTFGVSLEEAKAALDAADKALTDLKVVADAWASAKKAEGTAVDAEAAAEEWKAFKGACEDAVAVVLGQALKTFIAKVQANLPEGDAFDLRLNDGDREVVQFGLVRNGHLHTALSGAEWARVMAAMAEACVGEGKFAVLIPEERAFDPETLGEVLAAFGATKHQVILASPVAPKKAPKGWTIVKRGGAA